MYKKTAIIFISLVFICINLSGCMDSKEIDDEVYAITLGIDKGIKNKLRISIQYPSYKTGGGGEKKEKAGGMSKEDNLQQDGTNIDFIDAPSILEGINMLSMSLSRKVSIMHSKMLVISEEVAKEGINKYLTTFSRFRETRESIWMVVSKQRAEEFISANKVNIGNSISKSIELLFSENKYNNRFPSVHFGDFGKAMLSKYSQPYAVYASINNFENFIENKPEKTPSLIFEKGFFPGDIPRKGSSKIEFSGMAVFVKDKMVGRLDSYETSCFLLMLGKFPSGKWTFEDKNAPGKTIVADLRNGRKTKVKVNLKDGIANIDVKVVVEADIESIESRIHYEHYTKIPELNKMLEEALLKKSKEVIEKTQKEFKSDVFGFGKWVAGKFYTINDWEDYDWPSKYPKAKINISYKVETRRFSSKLQ